MMTYPVVGTKARQRAPQSPEYDETYDFRGTDWRFWMHGFDRYASYYRLGDLDLTRIGSLTYTRPDGSTFQLDATYCALWCAMLRHTRNLDGAVASVRTYLPGRLIMHLSHNCSMNEDEVRWKLRDLEIVGLVSILSEDCILLFAFPETRPAPEPEQGARNR
jgi:hypothetical protein